MTPRPQGGPVPDVLRPEKDDPELVVALADAAAVDGAAPHEVVEAAGEPVSVATVLVPQQDGEIRIARDGFEPTVYPVTSGQASVALADVPNFLANIEGSAVVGGIVPDADEGAQQ